MSRRPTGAAGRPISSRVWIAAATLTSVLALSAASNAGFAQSGSQSTSATTNPSAQTGIQVLLDQAKFWRERNRKDLEMESLRRVLELDPSQPDALYRMGQIELYDGNTAAAQKWLNELQAAAPNYEGTKSLAQQLRAGEIPQNTLAEARNAARQNQNARAITLYNEAFGGKSPPPEYALEYYQTLAGVEGQEQNALTGLKALANRRPNDAAVQLAYGEVLTYNAATRAQGIEILRKLAPRNRDAARAWRQAVLWLPENKSSADAYKTFLEAYPNDQQVKDLLAEATKPPPVDPTAGEITAGYAALNKDQLSTAETNFNRVLKRQPGNAGALGGLGLVALKREQFSTASTYLNRAIKADPSQRSKWTSALATANFYSTLRAAESAQKQGNLASAESLARKAADSGYKDSGDAQLLLAGILSEAGKYGQAEDLYRRLLRSNPNAVNVQKGLIETLLAQKKFQEAQALAAQLPSGETVPGLSQAAASIERARGEELEKAGQLEAAKLAYERAVAAAPSDPWIRLDLAKLLAQTGDPAQGRSLMMALLNTPNPSPDALQAAAFYAQEYGSEQEALALIDRVPPNKRTAEMREFTEQAQLRSTLQQAEQLKKAGRTGEAITLLRNLSTRADLPVGMKSQIALDLYQLGDTSRALGMAQDALQQRATGDPNNYGGFIEVFIQAGQDASASAMVQQLAAQATTPQQQQALAQLDARLAARRADQLRLAGNYAEAFDVISQALAYAPNDTQLLSTLARVYQSGGMADRSMQVYETLLQRDTTDPSLWSGAADAAAATGSYGKAVNYLDQALELDPQNPQLYLRLGQIEKSRGNRGAAIRALETAQTLQRQQMGLPEPGAQPQSPSPFTGAPPQTVQPYVQPPNAPGVLGPNPFRSGAAVGELNFETNRLANLSPRAPVAGTPVYRQAATNKPVVYANNSAEPINVRPSYSATATASAMPVSSSLAAPSNEPHDMPAQLIRARENYYGNPLTPPDASTYMASARDDSIEEQGSGGSSFVDAGYSGSQSYSTATSSGAAVTYSNPSRAQRSASATQIASVAGNTADPYAPRYAPPPSLEYAPTAPPSTMPPGYGERVPSSTAASQGDWSQGQTSGAARGSQTASAPYTTSRAQPPAAYARYGAAQSSAPQYAQAQYAPSQYGQPVYAPVQYSQTPPSASPQTGYAQSGYGQNAYDQSGYANEGSSSGGGAAYRQPTAVTPPYAGRYGYPQTAYDQAPAYAQAPTYTRGPAYAQAPSYAAQPGTQTYAPPTGQPAPLYAQQQQAWPYATASAQTPQYGSPSYASPDVQLNREIETTLAELKREVAPEVYADGSFRDRTGESGLSKLTELAAKVQGAFSPFGTGRMTLTAAPVSLDAGAVDSDAVGRFGTNPLLASKSTPEEQQAFGVGLNAAYDIDDVHVDIGTTPLGFEVTNFVGSAVWTPKLDENLTGKFGVQRRAVTDSVLSYAGTANIAAAPPNDAYAGDAWGGVVKTGGIGQISYDDGDVGVYGQAEYNKYTGKNVKDNTSIEINTGGYYKAFENENSDLQVGVNLNYTSYDNNQNYFTFGHGGYFSPQRFVSVAIPIKYEGRSSTGKFSYSVEAAPGYQNYRQDDADYFPNNPDLQADLAADVAAGTAEAAVYEGNTSSGVGFAGEAKAEYKLNDTTSLGGSVRFNNFGDFNETAARVYLTHIFGDW